MLRTVCILIISLFSNLVTAQPENNTAYSIMFYNVENLFDCKHDTLKNDHEFLEGEYKNWSYYRMNQKVAGISKVIYASNKWNTPSLIGLCEIENTFVLNQLIYNSGLRNMRYKYVHFESQDKRGIDVALLYKETDFELLGSSPIVASDSATEFYTRDALYAKGVIKQKDTIHIIVNHWPSKRGGALASESKRMRVADIISERIDSINNKDENVKILLMGDFNAELKAASVQSLINKHDLTSILNPKEIQTHKVSGSHKYQGHWSLIDHILITKNWLEKKNLQHFIVELPMLLEEDKTYSGVKPKRTYAGPRYIGGVSDHLPIMIRVDNKKEGEQTLPF